MGENGTEPEGDQESDFLDEILLSGANGWDTDMDESEMESETKEVPPNPDEQETLEIPSEHIEEAIESQWRLCGEDFGSDDEKDCNMST